jgi:spore coat protein U-like protein
MKKKKIINTVAMSLLTLSTSAFALGTTNSTTALVQSSAAISASCLVTSVDMNFGQLSPQASGQATSTSLVTATCTKSTNYTIALGTGSSGTYTARTLSGAKSTNHDKLSYNVYKDTTYGTILGDGTNGTSLLTGTGNGVQQSFTVYGMLQLNQYITPDNYSDNLSVTINY